MGMTINSGCDPKVSDPDILVIIVNWNTKGLLGQCLESLRSCKDATGISVVVVDNDSGDGSVEMVREKYPQCKIIRNDENIGFGRANNVAFKLYPNYAYYLLLNSDAMVTCDVIRGMKCFLDEHPDIGAAGPALKLPDGKFQYGGAGWGPSAIHSFITSMFLDYIYCRCHGLFIIQKHYSEFREPVPVDWLAGACMLVRSKTLREVGPFDERYFVYGEDAEWCWRARRNGWGMAYLPNVSATHNYRGSAVSEDIINVEWFRNLMDAVRRTSSYTNYLMFLLFSIVGYFLRAFSVLPLSPFHRRAGLMRHIRLYFSLLGEGVRLLILTR